MLGKAAPYSCFPPYGWPITVCRSWSEATTEANVIVSLAGIHLSNLCPICLYLSPNEIGTRFYLLRPA